MAVHGGRLLDPDIATNANHANGSRAIRPRRGLPSGRAVIGGLLVALAALGTFVAYTQSTARPRTLYVVASHQLAPGAKVAAADLALAPMDLPSSLRSSVFLDRSGVIGTVVLGPVGRGELLQRSNLAAGDRNGAARLSFSIEPSRAVDGQLVAGQRIDVLATYGGAGSEPYTVVVARKVLVSRVSARGSSMAGASSIVLTLSIDDPDELLAVAHAVRSGNLTVVLSGTADGRADAFRPPTPSGTGLIEAPDTASTSEAPPTTTGTAPPPTAAPPAATGKPAGSSPAAGVVH